MTNIAIEKITIEIVDFPIEHGGSFHSYVNVYQAGYVPTTSPSRGATSPNARTPADAATGEAVGAWFQQDHRVPGMTVAIL